MPNAAEVIINFAEYIIFSNAGGFEQHAGRGLTIELKAPRPNDGYDDEFRPFRLRQRFPVQTAASSFPRRLKCVSSPQSLRP